MHSSVRTPTNAASSHVTNSLTQPMVPMNLYVKIRGRVHGPYDDRKLFDMVQRGQLSRVHQVSTDGEHWERASTYAELFVARKQPPSSGSSSVKDAKNGSHSPTATEGPAATMAAPPHERWYFAIGKEAHGPVPLGELQRRLQMGQANGATKVWREGMSDWSEARHVPELTSLVIHNAAEAAISSTPSNGFVSNEAPSGGAPQRTGQQSAASHNRFAPAATGAQHPVAPSQAGTTASDSNAGGLGSNPLSQELAKPLVTLQNGTLAVAGISLLASLALMLFALITAVLPFLLDRGPSLLTAFVGAALLFAQIPIWLGFAAMIYRYSSLLKQYRVAPAAEHFLRITKLQGTLWLLVVAMIFIYLAAGSLGFLFVMYRFL